MKFDRTTIAIGLIGLIVAIGLPIAGKAMRQHAGPRCGHDGLRIERAYAVQVVDMEGKTRDFCCVHCAVQWLQESEQQPQAVLVTDEETGNPIDVKDAIFVRSSVATNPINRNRVHAFAGQADAEAHARAYGGWILESDERPFRDWFKLTKKEFDASK